MISHNITKSYNKGWDLWANFYKTIYIGWLLLFFHIFLYDLNIFPFFSLNTTCISETQGGFYPPLWVWQEAELWAHLETIFNYRYWNETTLLFFNYLTLGKWYGISKPASDYLFNKDLLTTIYPSEENTVTNKKYPVPAHMGDEVVVVPFWMG